MVGGIAKEIHQADDTAREICNAVKNDVEGKLGKALSEFTPISYRTQLVNGVNYFIKVRVGDGSHVHVRAHKTFQGDISFSNVQENQTEQSELSYFE